MSDKQTAIDALNEIDALTEGVTERDITSRMRQIQQMCAVAITCIYAIDG